MPFDQRDALRMGTAAITVAAVAIGVIIALEKGYPSPIETMIVLVCVALITGIVFWIVTPGSADFDAKSLGIKLGGGAAIGAAFMVLAWNLVSDSPQFSADYLVTDIPDELRGTNPSVERGRGISDAMLCGTAKDQLLVRFRDEDRTGMISFDYLGDNGQPLNANYSVRMDAPSHEQLLPNSNSDP